MQIQSFHSLQAVIPSPIIQRFSALDKIYSNTAAFMMTQILKEVECMVAIFKYCIHTHGHAHLRHYIALQLILHWQCIHGAAQYSSIQ